MKPFLTGLLLMSTQAFADDFNHWVEPPPAPISPTGAVLSVENYRCEVMSPRTFTCLNVGRVCVEQRKHEDEESAKIFGCAIKGEPTYPCPNGRPQKSDAELRQMMACTPVMYGAW